MSTLDDVVVACRYLLNNSPEAEPYRTYLDSRLSPKMQEAFCFGYLPGANNLNLLTAFVSQDRLREADFFYDRIVSDSFSHRTYQTCFFEQHPLILPYRDAYGEVIALVGRTLLDDAARAEIGIPKYKNTGKIFEKGSHLFGLFEAKRSIIEKDSVYVVEGQFDVIKAHENGITNIVALGSSSMTLNQLTLLCRYTNNIYLLLDNDAAGDSGRAGVVKKYGEVANIANIYLPSGYKDIDEFLQDNPGDSLPFIVRNVKYSL
jgi:DNA primase catalytic core